MMKTKLKLHLLLLTLLSLSGLAHAQGTTIGYQGRLIDGGLAATGLYDFTFNVFDEETGGAALAVPIVRDAVVVTNALFNVVLDFGPAVFNGPARWLEISVRANGVGVPRTLTPRTALLPTPYAIYAGIAGSVMDSSIDVDQFSTAGGGPTAGQFLSYDGASLSWSDPDVLVGNIWSRTGTVAHYDAGNVGIGTSTPAHRLSLAGGPNWTGNNWAGAIELANGAAIGWQANQGEKRFGMGHSFGGFYLFRTASDPGTTTGGPALYDFVVNDEGNVGIGTTTPTGRLHVHGGWDGEQGALQLSGHRPTLRFTGNADSGNQSWLLHLGGDGPGNLGFYRRTGLSTWSSAMQFTPSGRLEMNGDVRINGGSGIALNAADGPMITRGWDPFNGNASANKVGHGRWGLFMEPGSLVCGIPDITGSTFEVRSYAPDGYPARLFSVNQNGIVSIHGNVGIGLFGLGTPGPLEKLHVVGNILASGTITGSSDRNVKRDFTPVNSSEVLEKVAALPISTWSFIDDQGVRHLGPMAQDFHSAFNVGMDDKHISMVDADGVALAAIQGLNQKLNDKAAEVRELKARLERLENLLTQQHGGAK